VSDDTLSTGSARPAGAGPGSQAAACDNCGAPLHGRFCSACGQEAKPLNPRLRDILRDLIEELFDLDGRVFRSVRRLFLSPGFLTREQFLGRRVSWLAPLRLYLLFSVLYFAVAAFTDRAAVRVNVTTGRPSSSIERPQDPAGAAAAQASSDPAARAATEAAEAAALRRAGYDSQKALHAAVLATQATWLPRVMFVLVPVFAALVALVRRGSGIGYPLHVYFALHVHAAWFGVTALSAAGHLWRPAVGEAIESVRAVYIVVYIYLALRTAYGISRGRALRDTLVVTVAYFIVLLAAMAAIFLPLVFPFWRG